MEPELMGSWGYKTFEDDTTLDWLGSFEANPTVDALTAALNDALSRNYIDDLASAGALAAAEVIAAMNGNAVARLSRGDSAGKWISQQSSPSSELLELAKQAVRKVFGDSEFREIWEDSGKEALSSWKAEIDDLIFRLS